MPLRETKIAPAFFIGLGGCGGTIVDEIACKVKQEESFSRYRDLIQFFAFDTDADDLARLHWIDTSHKFSMAQFDKPEFVDLKQGKLHASEDPLFTQWWPEWYRPRSTRGKGAGQIRIESRMSLYYQLENDRGKVLQILDRAIRNAYDVHNPYRDNSAARIHIFASLAGGTGSGGFATIALTLRRLLGGQRGHSIIGTFVMPNVFRARGLPPNQFDKIMANGYAALQELELLQSASPQMPVRFHYDPDHPEHATFDRPPFDQVYLVEEKTAAGVVIADATQFHAVADAAHTQIFSPILHKQGSTLDNDTRELMQLDEQSFTKSFGSFGISALILPVTDILEYCAVRLARDLLVAAVPGGVQALGDGHSLDDADRAFADGVRDRAESERADDARAFGRIVAWVEGGDAEGEGALAAFLRRTREDVARDVDQAIRLRAWDETELGSFEGDAERVQAELQGGWAALKNQLARSEEESRRRAQRAAAEVIAGAGAMSLEEITRGRGPTENRYLYIRLRQALLEEQAQLRERYDRAISFDDDPLQEEFRRQVAALAKEAPRTLLERLPGRDNKYFAAAAEFANWYRETLSRLRLRVRANALLEFCGVVLADLDRRREASMHFFARIDRITHLFEDRAETLLERGGPRDRGGDANQFILDVEVLKDHRTGTRLWDHLYPRLVTTADFQMSDALTRLAAIAGEGGSEQDIQRRIVDSLLETTSRQLRPRIAGGRDSAGLRLDEELEHEARLVAASRRFAEDRQSPPPGDPAWADEMRRADATVAGYIKDKLDFAASKCQPFITLATGAPYLPEKAYAVLLRDYRDPLGATLHQLANLPLDGGQLVDSEESHRIVFYKAQLGCALHAVRSLVDYERRYRAVVDKELAEAAKVPGQPPGTPQIPIHQDKNWEGAPDPHTALFRISIEGVKANESKIAWYDRHKELKEAAVAASVVDEELRDFTLGVAFGHIELCRDGAAGDGWYLADDSLDEERRRLGKFRDLAFEAYRNRNSAQKDWLKRAWAASLRTLDEERRFDELAKVFDDHVTKIEVALRNADHAGGEPLASHLERERGAFEAFRAERGQA
jgi:hypothetical protein